MRSSTRWHRRCLAPLVALAMLLAACGDDEAEPVLFGDEQEPEVLNALTLAGNSLVTAKVFNNQFPGSYVIQPDFSLEPFLIDGEAEITEDPFSVTYRIREDAAWSDGTPVTVDDYVFTYETIADTDAPHAGDITSRIGYDLIDRYETDGDKTITFHFTQPYAPWKLLFWNILPAHVLDGEDFATVMNESLPDVSAGPFVFESWDRGTQLRLVRNDNYWAGDVGIAELVMRYVPDTTTLTQRMVGGEIHMFDPQPQIELLEQLASVSDRVVYEVGLGPDWEHLSFNTAVDGLDRDYIRQAIALGIDRQQIVDTLIHPVDPDAVVLQQPFWMTNSEHYEPTFDRWDHDPQAAVALLEDNGCTRDGGPDGDTFVCDGIELSFRISTTSGNERREFTQELIRADLREVGIAIEIDNDEFGAFFARFIPPDACEGVCDYDIALFSLIGSPDPSGLSNLYGCDDDAPRPQNWTRHCNVELTSLMDQANSAVDPDANAALWNQAARAIADDVPILPLYQQPLLLAWDDSLSGPELNTTGQTVFWNSGEWVRVE